MHAEPLMYTLFISIYTFECNPRMARWINVKKLKVQIEMDLKTFAAYILVF